MIRAKTPAAIILSFLTIVLLIPAAGCDNAPDVIDFIRVSPEAAKPPTLIVPDGKHNPFPKDVHLTVSPGDKIFIILGISAENETSVKFSKYTFYNRGTKQEAKIDDAGDLGPFEPGADVLIGFSNPWPVPDQPGTYEVRVYLNNRLVAAVVFEVK